MGIPPGKAKARPEFQRPTVGQSLGSALYPLLLHWTWDQLPDPRTSERCSEEQPLSLSQNRSVLVKPDDRQRNNCHFSHSCSTESPFKPPGESALGKRLEGSASPKRKRSRSLYPNMGSDCTSLEKTWSPREATTSPADHPRSPLSAIRQHTLSDL